MCIFYLKMDQNSFGGRARPRTQKERWKCKISTVKSYVPHCLGDMDEYPQTGMENIFNNAKKMQQNISHVQKNIFMSLGRTTVYPRPPKKNSGYAPH